MSSNTPNPNQQGLPPQQQQQQAHAGLIRVEQIRSLPHLTDTQKTQYETAVRGLREQLQKHRPNSSEYQASLSKLTEFTNSMRNSLRRYQLQQQQLQQQQQQQQAANAEAERRPNSQTGQLRPQTQPGQGQPVPGGAVSQPAAGQLPPAIVAHVREFPFTLPPQIQSGTHDAEKWLNEAKARYGQALHKLEVIKQRMSILQASIQRRIDEGKPFTPEEQADLGQKRVMLQKSHAEAKRYIDGFRQQQLEFQNGQIQGQGRQIPAGANGGGQGNAMEGVSVGNPNQQQQPPPVGTAGQTTQPISAPVKPEPRQLEGASEVKEEQPQQSGSNEGATASPVVTGQGPGQTVTTTAAATTSITNTPSTSQPISTMAPSGTPTSAGGYQNLPRPSINNNNNNINNNNQPSIDTGSHQNTGRGYPPHLQHGTPQQINSPQSARPPSATHSDRPQPLSYQAASSQAARSHSSNNIQSATPPTSGFPGHALPPTTTTHELSNQKLHVPKILNVSQPQPVQLGANRPTFSGGASGGANMPVNQPAMIRAPEVKVEFEKNPEGNGRVLSKSKLYELVREVTGPTEKSGEQLLAPDLEEVSLEYIIITRSLYPSSLHPSSTEHAFTPIHHHLPSTYSLPSIVHFKIKSTLSLPSTSKHPSPHRTPPLNFSYSLTHLLIKPPTHEHLLNFYFYFFIFIFY